MALRALDALTTMKALNQIDRDVLEGGGWTSNQPQHRGILHWYEQFASGELAAPRLDAIAGHGAVRLNGFLAAHDRQPVVREPFFDVGAVSTFDMTSNWTAPQGLYEGDCLIGKNGVEIYDAQGWGQTLRIKTTDGGSLWVVDNPPRDDRSLIQISLDVLGACRMRESKRTVTLPLYDIEVTTELRWLKNLRPVTPKAGLSHIEHAMQQFQLQVTQKGLRLAITTYLAPIVRPVNRPADRDTSRVLMFFTTPENPQLPIGGCFTWGAV